MATTRTVLRGQLTTKPVDLYMSLELGDKHWRLSIGDGRGGVSRYSVEAGHTEEVADCIAKAAARHHTSSKARCTAATKPAVTAGGCIAGYQSTV